MLQKTIGYLTVRKLLMQCTYICRKRMMKCDDSKKYKIVINYLLSCSCLKLPNVCIAELFYEIKTL